MSWLHPGGGSQILAPTTRRPRVAGENVDWITRSRAARPRKESIDAQALDGSRVEIAADDRCCHLLPVLNGRKTRKVRVFKFAKLRVVQREYL